jgi:hypothetical protein
MSECYVLVKQMNDLVFLEPIEFVSEPEEGTDNSWILLLRSHAKAHCGGAYDHCGILVFEQSSHIQPISV